MASILLWSYVNRAADRRGVGQDGPQPARTKARLRRKGTLSAQRAQATTFGLAMVPTLRTGTWPNLLLVSRCDVCVGAYSGWLHTARAGP